MMEKPAAHHPIIVFDGICVLCSANAQFVLKFDRKGVFRLAAMQSEVGADLMRQAGIDPEDPDSFIIVEQGRVLRDSDAVISMWKRLGWPWKIVGLAGLIPRGIRDPLYRLIARNRYRIFGKRETCWMPSPEQAKRIL
ncbi:thiol-disulfide oxidoreductase DCC family protein [Pontixanthobacter sp. CEM42]|uniref:thiol-disulfide oxidoreductase DCC family protein n=1 Tax=Pontixanthobacter sp. CEM42 TaxID=2792077 RepID=UPI001FD77418|nr:thiol-disulfide oxidoreductase DCC family protein [Pontixanthobacter sp. CEM42]